LKYTVLFQKVDDIIQLGLKEEEIKTTNYSVFQILNVEKYEDETHTPFLSDLLNLHGQHYQKDLFYKLFIEHIFLNEIERERFLPTNPLFFNIINQKGVYTDFGQGFLDIFIDYTDIGRKSFSIVIENKIYHGDGDDQLNKYISYLESLFRDNILLVYLTLSGKPPESNSMKHERVKELEGKGKLKLVSYHRDIHSILIKSLPLIKSEKVMNTILQYLTVINSL
jgi:hypothetical protein